GPKWTTGDVHVGEGVDERTHIVHFRDILEVIRELIGARRFRNFMRYVPERHWTSKSRTHRVYDEMWSGDWWWRMQYLIRNKNGTVVPLIIATDETTLTNNPRGPKGYPVYLSIGNISKSVRRKPTKRGMVVIGYLPVDSFEDVADTKLRTRYRGELLHRSLDKIFKPLKTASSDGLLAWCSDGYLRHIHPIIAAWVADWPEQNDIACTLRNGCPKCLQKYEKRGRGGPMAPARDHETNERILRTYQETGRPAVLKPLRLKPWPAFWEGIPHVDIGASLTPDLLHQLYKGMFEHARDWVEDLLGTEEFNRRFKVMPRAQDLRHFKKGVTTVKLWAGRESRDMMRQFLPVVIDAQAPPELIQVIRALLDFSYLAHGEQLSDIELAEMEEALALFHKAKYVLVRMDMVTGIGAFDRLAKLHMLSHYTESIRQLGTPDGYSTETPEHLHIIYVKTGWRMSSRRDPIPQIVKYVRRLEAIQLQRTLVDEYYGERPGEEVEEVSDMYGDDEDESQDEEVPAVSEIHYPRPTISIAKRPTVRSVPGRVLITSYGATDLLRALRRFLLPKARLRGEKLLLLPSDNFDVWHKATLRHLPLSFTPDQPCHRDVIRVRPVTWDTTGRVVGAGTFDTALFPVTHNLSGLSRFRAGRVRAIFTLPPHLHHLHSGPLVFLDVFTPFSHDISSHCLYETTQAYSDAGVASLVLPLSCLVMACHLVPNFSSPSLPPNSPQRVSTNDCFFFNNYYNYFTFLLMSHWRRVRLAPPD
ncbi:hypothetical protein BDV93DRAFT_457131, partial [Ceratobasidium sp. AG-I]